MVKLSLKTLNDKWKDEKFNSTISIFNKILGKNIHSVRHIEYTPLRNLPAQLNAILPDGVDNPLE
jgi:hypothetical protein